jgi:adenylylsulfate kinase
MHADATPGPVQAAVFWFTGIPGSGKTTVSSAVAEILRGQGCPVAVLDGDALRKGLNSDLGFAREDRRENVRRIGEVALLLASQGIVCLCAVIAPFREDRRRLRERMGPLFHEVYVSCPPEICAERDPKGHYARANRGEIKQFTGISDAYEPPEHPELVLPTHQEDLAASVERTMAYMAGATGA